MNYAAMVVIAAASLALALVAPSPEAAAGELSTLEALGEALFFDVDLSENRTQSCASCHNPDHGFVDPLETKAGRAASLGDDGRSIGDRNTPTAAYARFSPVFAKGTDGKWRGGQFHDGRAATLEEQAGGPPLNPSEMGMPSKAAVVERLKEKPGYVTAYERLFGANVLADTDAAYDAMTRALAAFERTDRFAPFDSKYDRHLRGEATLTEQEELGRVLFFSKQFTNCSLCHRLKEAGGAEGETFTDHTFHNIGVPENRALRAVNGVAKGTRDRGLAANPAVGGDRRQEGKFKVPTLRNVAVTGPYMHNGVFKDLRTVVLFYNKYNSKNPARQIDPETGVPWGRPEIAANLSLTELESGPALDDRRIDALVAFLETLTDRRYEDRLSRK
ncbi:MAG: cytochrome-c peroxidase [Siculibacillus sp.]|nr:cytochrome-c peroxidase [Siculibacillus sp.]